MKVYRKLINELLQWRDRPKRLPLILRGVRQVGKTEALTTFGQDHFDSMLKVDLEKDKGAASIFREFKDPVEILKRLQILMGERLSESGLLFIDEIHACPPALTALKYFAEDLPRQAVAAAGSHLGILLAGIVVEENFSFPVGKVEFLDLSPVTFEEFTTARGFKEDYEQISKEIVNEEFPISEAFHQRLWDLWKEYLVVGGLPEVITDFIDASKKSLLDGFNAARHKQDSLITAYEADIAKHSGKVNAQHVIRVLRSIPNQLMSVTDQSTRRFTFKDVVPGVRGYDRLSGAIDWLTSSGLSLRLPVVKQPTSPLKAFSDEHLFKLFLFDIGILGALGGIAPNTLYEFSFGMYKGYFAESFVFQELIATQRNLPIVSWQAGHAEVEFVMENQNGVTPVEVKSSHKFTSRSLASFENRYNPKSSFILSARRGGNKGRRKEVPLYMASIINTL